MNFLRSRSPPAGLRPAGRLRPAHTTVPRSRRKACRPYARRASAPCPKSTDAGMFDRSALRHDCRRASRLVAPRSSRTTPVELVSVSPSDRPKNSEIALRARRFRRFAVFLDSDGRETRRGCRPGVVRGLPGADPPSASFDSDGGCMARGRCRFCAYAEKGSGLPVCSFARVLRPKLR